MPGSMGIHDKKDCTLMQIRMQSFYIEEVNFAVSQVFFLLLSAAGKQCCGIRQHCCGTLQNSMHVSDGDTVIRHRNFLIAGAFLAVSHLTLVEHAAAAMDDETIRREIFREFSSGSK